MNTLLKVTPEKLIEASERFSQTEQNVRNITSEMTAIVDNFKTIWQGEAATSFANRFNSLSDDMERLYAMIREHASDLIEMANEYKSAEEESMAQIGSLSTEALM